MWFVLAQYKHSWEVHIMFYTQAECETWLTENGVSDGPAYVIAEAKKYSKLVAIPKWQEIPIIDPADEIPF